MNAIRYSADRDDFRRMLKGLVLAVVTLLALRGMILMALRERDEIADIQSDDIDGTEREG